MSRQKCKVSNKEIPNPLNTGFQFHCSSILPLPAFSSVSPPMNSYSCPNESALLITHHEFCKPTPKFPLGLVSESYRPYLELIRIEKPTGTILMFWPFAWGLTMAAYATSLTPGVYALNLAKALVGAFILRSSACTINDIFDRKVDAGVDRTRNRPLPSGRISVLAATVYLIFQYALGVAFFYLSEDGAAFGVALFQLIPLFAIYPLLKRVTHWPQAWLGLAMNFGFVTAWISVSSTVNYPMLSMAMASCWCWTMLYDTVYACQDIKDDVNMGVRSTAILFGTWIRPLLITCGLAFAMTLAVAGHLNNQGAPFFIISVGGTFIHLVWQFTTVDLDVPKSCGMNFIRNGQLGWIIWGGLALDYIFSLCETATV
ncbi:UbiA prenyltransferase family-domain-containing protein [Mycena maculata]|uniref:4-hydroxybenzoate polyprenyltransferase, mitochondrial n=1 Tax=Mycena maculata TaxID=230809 RepID=A0AAD7IGI2_9AGAR|nr:UbiA prenyltransferase family-domain-containing protein [Mycena maculata]